MSSVSSKYNEAFKCIENAKWYEKSGDLAEAKKLYVQGIGYFLEIMKLETNVSKKQIVEQNINTFIKRAEVLQSQMKQQNIQQNDDYIYTITPEKPTQARLTESKEDHTIQNSAKQSIHEVQTTQSMNIENTKDTDSEIKTQLNIEKNKCITLQQTIKELENKVNAQQTQVSTINETMSSLQNELQHENMENALLNEEIEALKEKNDTLTEDTSKLYVSLEHALSFGNDTVYRWYPHLDGICAVKIEDNKMIYLDGNIEYDKDTQTTPYKLHDIKELCKYIVNLRLNTESSLFKIEIPDENKNDDCPVLERQKSSYNCLICMDAAPDMFNYPCGHACYCRTCAEEAIKENKTCPNCRQEIIQCINIIAGGFKEE